MAICLHILLYVIQLPCDLTSLPPSLTSLPQYMFVTELDGSKRRAVHDELAKLLVQYLKKLENPQRLTMVLDVSVCVCVVCVWRGGWVVECCYIISIQHITHTHIHTHT